jgi:hypothetical protein
MILLFLVSYITDIQIQAQSDTIQYVLPEFAKGIVKMKDGHSEVAMMDYNTLTEEMIFYKNGVLLALDSLEKIDTVYLESRIFVPQNKVFYELLVKGPVSLFVQHKSNPVDSGNPSGYGGTTETGASKNVSSLTNSIRTYKLELPKNYYVTDATLFWIRKNNIFYKANSSNQIRKVFPEKSKEIKQFMKENKLDLKNADDMIKLIIKCNEFVR